jgi:hypothetical protein
MGAKDEQPFTIKDRFGVSWVVKPTTLSASGVVYNVMLLGPDAAYGTQPQQSVVVVKDKAQIAPEVDAYINDFLASGGTPPKRAGDITVSAKADTGAGVFLFLLVLLAVASKGRR